MPFTEEFVLHASHLPMGSTIECVDQASGLVSWSGSQYQERYQKMWQHYREGIRANNPVQLDYRVAHRAVATGQHCQQEIALMLVVGSPHVAQLHQRKGKNAARNYVNQIAKTVCLRMQTQEGKTIEISL